MADQGEHALEPPIEHALQVLIRPISDATRWKPESGIDAITPGAADIYGLVRVPYQ